jgi:hypothetical protein
MRRICLWAALAIALQGCGGESVGEEDEEAAVQAPADPYPAAAACGKDTWKTYAAGFFRAQCASCHGRAFATRGAVRSSGARGAISSGRMPRDKPLGTAQRKRVLAWFACGAP